MVNVLKDLEISKQQSNKVYVINCADLSNAQNTVNTIEKKTNVAMQKSRQNEL